MNLEKREQLLAQMKAHAAQEEQRRANDPVYNAEVEARLAEQRRAFDALRLLESNLGLNDN